MERDRMVRRLRAADGIQFRATRPDEPGDPRQQVDRIPPAGIACFPGETGQEVRLHLSGQPRRSLGGG